MEITLEELSMTSGVALLSIWIKQAKPKKAIFSLYLCDDEPIFYETDNLKDSLEDIQLDNDSDAICEVYYA